MLNLISLQYFTEIHKDTDFYFKKLTDKCHPVMYNSLTFNFKRTQWVYMASVCLCLMGHYWRWGSLGWLDSEVIQKHWLLAPVLFLITVNAYSHMLKTVTQIQVDMSNLCNLLHFVVDILSPNFVNLNYKCLYVSSV